MAQLVDRLLPIPEVRGLNPVIGKTLFILNICLLSTVYRKDENKEKEAGNGPFFKKRILNTHSPRISWQNNHCATDVLFYWFGLDQASKKSCQTGNQLYSDTSMIK